MTVQETSDRFDYAMSKSVGGVILDEYSKSLYLTKAQLQFVRGIIKAYEYTDEMRHIIAPILVTVPLATTDFTQTSKYWTTTIIPNEILSIVYEETNLDIPTIPMDFNDIHYTVDNPFRKPDPSIAYRVTVGDELRLYTSESLTNYLYIYCQYPNPIVLENFTGTNLTVSGEVLPTPSQLTDDSVIQIIDMAVRMVLQDMSMTLAGETKEEE